MRIWLIIIWGIVGIGLFCANCNMDFSAKEVEVHTKIERQADTVDPNWIK